GGFIQSIISGAIDVELLVLKGREHRTPQNISLCRGTRTNCRHLFCTYFHWFMRARFLYWSINKLFFWVSLSCVSIWMASPRLRLDRELFKSFGLLKVEKSVGFLHVEEKGQPN